MVAGVAALDYDGDGCTDIFFVNGAALPSLVKTGPEFYNRLYRNNCDMTFTDVTAKAGLAGEGYSMAVATGDYDNDGRVDIFVAGVNRNLLYRNRGDGTFEDVTGKAGAQRCRSEVRQDVGRLGRLVRLRQRRVARPVRLELRCLEPGRRFPLRFGGGSILLPPEGLPGLPNQLFHNNHDGTFTDVSRVRASGGVLAKAWAWRLGISMEMVTSTCSWRTIRRRTFFSRTRATARSGRSHSKRALRLPPTATSSRAWAQTSAIGR